VQPEQLVPLVLKVQQALMGQMALMVQQDHKGHKALLALKVHRAIRD
jgi:hypothetical protein|tara:strand:- start:126 stop:266 length:141 start_codon:yes stop_codon:yes gene_type:complete